MIRKLAECSLGFLSRSSVVNNNCNSMSLIRPCKWNQHLRCKHQSALQQLSQNYSCSWVLCSRYLKNTVQTQNRCLSAATQARPSISAPALRYYSSLHEQCHKDSEEDTLYKWIELRCKGHDDAVLESYQMFVSMAAKELGIQVDNIMKPRRTIKRLSLLKSRFIYKKHFVQYEMRTHFRVITLKHLTGSTADVFLEYIERNLPEGIAMQIKKCHLEKIPEQLNESPVDDGNDVEQSSGAGEGEVGNQVAAKSSSSSSSEESGTSSSDSDSESTTKP